MNTWSTLNCIYDNEWAVNNKNLEFLGDQFPGAKWDQLSMGMSGDYEVGIQEGATFVRIGTAILGERA